MVLPDLSEDYNFGPCVWGAAHGSTLPAQGAAATVAFDDNSLPVVVWWDGVTQFPSVAPVHTFVFNQIAPSTTWHINHNLNEYPSVTVADSAGTVVVGDVAYVDTNNITLTFTAAFSGEAYLN